MGESRLERTLRGVLRGDVQFDGGTLGAYSTDSSNYRQVPLGVVFPRDRDDVVAAVVACAEFGVPVLARGAGTSLAGQACNEAVVIDTSRFMTRIIEIDPDKRLARVEPGVVLDDLRAAAEAYGLTFGPDPATHAWCTLGGMIGNNSCGAHALYAGKTVDNVDSLEVVTYSGDVLDLGAYDDRQYANAVAQGGAAAPILGGLRELGKRYADLIRDRYPNIPRRVSGYNLDELLPERGFHVARAIVGSESTCAIVTAATVMLSTSPRHRRLIVLGYRDIFAAADAVPSLLRHSLLALEGFDAALTHQMASQGLNVAELDLLPAGAGWLLAEVGDDDATIADDTARDLIASLPADVNFVSFTDIADQRRIWNVRDSALGASARRDGGGHNFEGWEDAAVSPARLGEYLRGLKLLWDEYGYTGTWYGHFGQGCVHTRNNFDFGTTRGLAQFRTFVERAADLVISLGGSLSGEHGDGQARGELLGRMYGPELLVAFRQFKAIFDPLGRMNPGKLVDAYPLDANMKFGPAYKSTHLQPSFFAFADDGGSLQMAAERCVGVGRCRRDDTGIMCPSYRATRDERHSTRGRAKLLVEMFQGEVTPASWRNQDVRASLDLCLSCKGCAVDCPTHVDMATYKAEFLSHHYRRRLRPRAMYALGLIPWTARVASRMPRVANVLLRWAVSSSVLLRAAGLTTRRRPPAFARKPLRRMPIARSTPQADPTVVVWPDTFTNAYRPDQAVDLIAVLQELGERVVIPADWACCGRPLYDMGMLGLARRTLRRLLDVLDPYVRAGLPIVVIEPSCLAAFRDELPGLLSDDPRAARLAGAVRSPSEFLLTLDRLTERVAARTTNTARGKRSVIHPHCHERAAGNTGADRKLLQTLGYDVSILDAGCCGLAGSFGFRAEHEALSRKIGNEYWLPKLRKELAGGRLVATGFSCVTQLDHLDGPLATSPISLVRGFLEESSSPRNPAS